jgi:hypothetical protein
MRVETQALRTRARILLVIFIILLVLSGLTTIPIQWEMDLLHNTIGEGTFMERMWPALAQWISFIHQGVMATAQEYPFMLYGLDWLAFAHIVIGIAFIGPLRDPVKNLWVIEFGMIACILVIPTALIFGPMRGIPFFWRLIDSAFGVFGILPLWLTHRTILRIIALEQHGTG